MLVWCRGDIYVNKFLCGVDGVSDAGKDVLEILLGGVCDLVGSFMVVECDEGNIPESGECASGVSCGTEE
jgi:hypothetical protein